MRSLFPRLHLLGLLALPAAAQVPVGYAVVATGGATLTPGLFLYEPLNARFAPIDASVLPAGFRVSRVHVARDGQRLLIAGAPAGAVDDVVLATTLQGNALTPPTAFAQGLTGRTLAMFVVAATGQVVMVTGRAVFAAPITGGPAIQLTPPATDMGNLAAILEAPATVLTSAVDALGQAILWRLEVPTRLLGTIPLRVMGRLLVTTGPTAESVLLGEPTGQIWRMELSTSIRTPWVHLGRGPLRAMWSYEDQQAWFAGVGTDIQHVGQQVLGPSVPVPGAAIAADIGYRSYGSAVSPYGTACRGTGATLPAIGAQGRPVPGNRSFALTVGNTRPTTPVALMLGASATNVSLGFLGMTGCFMLMQPAVSLSASTTAAGSAQVPIGIPPDPGLAGVRLFAQWLIVDVGANTASLITSDGARVDI